MYIVEDGWNFIYFSKFNCGFGILLNLYCLGLGFLYVFIVNMLFIINFVISMGVNVEVIEVLIFIECVFVNSGEFILC